MSGNVSLDGGAGGIQPQHEIESGGKDGAVADPAEMQAKVNALPDAEELGGADGELGVGSADGGIPRDTAHIVGEQQAIHATVNPDGPDETAALGGSALTVAVEAANGQDVQQGAVRHAEVEGYQADLDTATGGLTLTGPDGIQREGRVDGEGVITLDVEETDRHGPAQVVFRDPPVDGELTVQVDPLDGRDPEDVTIDVTETTDGTDPALKKEKESDLEENPEPNVTWLDRLHYIAKAMEPLEKWIESHMGAGKPNI